MNGIDSFFHHVLTWTGTYNESGGWYGFWSGFAGGFGILTILVVGYRKINCHTQRCWRIGHHDLVVKHSDADPGTTYRVCRHCHPEIRGRRFSPPTSVRCTAPTWQIRRPRGADGLGETCLQNVPSPVGPACISHRIRAEWSIHNDTD